MDPNPHQDASLPISAVPDHDREVAIFRWVRRAVLGGLIWGLVLGVILATLNGAGRGWIALSIGLVLGGASIVTLTWWIRSGEH